MADMNVTTYRLPLQHVGYEAKVISNLDTTGLCYQLLPQS
jgi:hypothetical protein